MSFFENVFNTNNPVIDTINVSLIISASLCLASFCTAWSIYICYKVKQIEKAREQAQIEESNIDNSGYINF